MIMSQFTQKYRASEKLRIHIQYSISIFSVSASPGQLTSAADSYKIKVSTKVVVYAKGLIASLGAFIKL